MAFKKKNATPAFNPYVVLIIGIIGVSTGSIFARLADAPALVTAAYRMGLAALILIPFAAWKARDELRSLSLHDIKLALLSGFFLALHFATWISSLDYTAIANSVVLVNTIPLWVGLFTPLISKDRIRGQRSSSIIVSVVGRRHYRFRRFCNRRQGVVGRFAGDYRGCMRRGLPALRAKITPQTFPAFICCHLLWQCGCHFMAGCAIFKSANYRLQYANGCGVLGHGRHISNSRSLQLQLVS